MITFVFAFHRPARRSQSSRLFSDVHAPVRKRVAIHCNDTVVSARNRRAKLACGVSTVR